MTEKMTSSIKLIKLDTATFHGEKVDPTYVNFFFGKERSRKEHTCRCVQASGVP
jgi:hypothetical protein